MRPPHLVVRRRRDLPQVDPRERPAHRRVQVRRQPALRLHGGEVLHVPADGPAQVLHEPIDHSGEVQGVAGGPEVVVGVRVDRRPVASGPGRRSPASREEQRRAGTARRRPGRPSGSRPAAEGDRRRPAAAASSGNAEGSRPAPIRPRTPASATSPSTWSSTWSTWSVAAGVVSVDPGVFQVGPERGEVLARRSPARRSGPVRRRDASPPGTAPSAAGGRARRRMGTGWQTWRRTAGRSARPPGDQVHPADRQRPDADAVLDRGRLDDCPRRAACEPGCPRLVPGHPQLLCGPARSIRTS